jgi:NADH-quinone oxidoreductase subunit N
MSEYWVLLPVILTAILAFLFLVLTFVVRLRKETLASLAAIALGVVGYLNLDMLLPADFSLGTRLGLWSSPVDAALPQLMLHVNAFALLLNLTFVLVGLLVVLVSRGFLRPEEPHHGEYYALLLLSILGMFFVALATELFTLYLAFELSTLATFALAAFRKLDPRGSEAAMKFFIVGVVSSAIILFGISLLYGVAGHVTLDRTQPLTSLEVLRRVLDPQQAPLVGSFQPTVALAAVLLIAGFGFKVATVPFHMWAPDVYEGSPTTISAFLSTASKNMGFVALFKVFLVAVIAARVNWVLALGVLAIATQTLGNVAALPQKSVKRMLAYSSIAHAGYILSAVVIASVHILPGAPGCDAAGSCPPDIAILGLQGGLYHILVYAFMNGGAFLVVGVTASLRLGETLDDFRGLGRKMPFVAAAMAIFLLSLAGIPGLGGFTSKFILFASAVVAGANVPGAGWMVALAISGVLNSALSLYYYARVVKYMYFLEAPVETRIPVPKAFTASVAVAMAGTVATGILAFLFLPTVGQAAHSFLFP